MFFAIDDEIEYVPVEYVKESTMELSDYKGIKFCLKDENRRCYEQCYDDSEFCSTVVFLGYPEDKIKYPNAYEIIL